MERARVKVEEGGGRNKMGVVMGATMMYNDANLEMQSRL